MKRILLCITIILVANIAPTKANNHKSNTPSEMETPNDSLRLTELNHFWTELSRTVSEGDF